MAGNIDGISGKHLEKDGRGRRVTNEVRMEIRNSFMRLVREGESGRGLSASAIERNIILENPDLSDSIPSRQSINAIVKPLRDNLNENRPLDSPWSLNLWMREPHNIAKEDLPIILEVQADIEFNRKERLTVREARWVVPIKQILSHQQATESSVEVQDYSDNLTDEVKRYALRERVIELLEKFGNYDSYDLDINLAVFGKNLNAPQEIRNAEDNLS